MNKQIIKIVKHFKEIALIFTGIYIWIASCHYLYYNVNETSANACAYGGMAFVIFSIIYFFINGKE